MTTPEFNNLPAMDFTARLAEANLTTKTNFDDKLISLNQKINSNKTKHLPVEKKLKKLQTFDSVYFREKTYIEEDGTQNYLVFQLMYRYFQRVVNSYYILEWKFKRLSDINLLLHLIIFLIQD